MSGSIKYDFLSPENKSKWEKELLPGLRKIQKQVHPRLNIDEDAIEFLEVLVYQLLSQVCSSKPHGVPDVEEHVQATFAYPIDQWSLNEAHEKLEKHSARKRNVFLFPIDKIHHQLMKEVLGYKLDVSVVQFIMNVLDYVAADILKLAGIFVKNTHMPTMTITKRDVLVSLSADTSLQALFKFQTTDLNVDVEINTDLGSMKYDELLRDLIDNESHFIRQLNLLLKVFYPPFYSNPDVFPDEDIDQIFGPVQYVYELSVSLLGSIEEMIEMASEMSVQGSTHPQIGFCFEEITESGETGCYIDYTDRYSDAVVALEKLMDDPQVINYLKRETLAEKLPKLYIEAVKYVLPKALLEPIYHFFYYYAIMTAMSQVTDDDDDLIAFESAISVALADKLLVEKLSQRFLPKKKEEAGLFGRRAGFKFSVKKLNDIQSKVEGWEGPDIHSHCTELIKEGPLMVARDSGRKAAKQKVERYVFLLDGLVICCKTRKNGNTIVEYRMKEKLTIKRNMMLKDLDDSDDMKFAFELIPSDQPSLKFSAKGRPEKNEWMAAFTALLTRSAFERLLNSKLREEEKNIPTLVPDSKKYLFAEPDSDENILFEEELRDNHLLIKAATIHKLIERLTYHEYADPTFVRTFLMTYRSFCKPGELLNLLIDRYHIPSPVDTDDLDARRDPLQREAMKRFKANYVSPIQLRVLNVLRHWVENHYYDFEQDPAALNHLKEFVGTVKAKNVQKWVSSIHRALAKREGKGDQSISTNPVFFQSPPPIEWHIAKNKDEFNLLTLHPLEFARQLTLILSELFRAIQSSELVDASWTKDSKKETASPNLLKMSRFETKLTNWIRHTIVFTENFEERVALYSRLIDIMMELKEMNNFAALFAINAAFQCSQVFRLKHTSKLHDVKKKQVLDEIQQLCESGRGYKNYKERLRSINPPCVPFLGMYLTWIVFIRDGNDGRVKGKPEHFINFKKRRMIANILQEIQQYQNSRYCLKSEPLIQEYIKSHDVQGEISHNQWEDLLFDQSLEIEPRDQPPKKTPRENKFDLRPPSAHPKALSQILDATIRRPTKKPNPEETTQEEASKEGAGGVAATPESSMTNSLEHSNKQHNEVSSPVDNNDVILPPKPPPKLPPKPQQSLVVGYDTTGGTNSPPPILPRSSSPTDPHLTYRKPPRPIPVNVEPSVPPRIPRREQPSPSPPSPLLSSSNKLQDENVPPIPPRPHSPYHHPVLSNEVVPPIPPPPVMSKVDSPPPEVPPPLRPRVSSNNNNTVDNKMMDDMEATPPIPPKPSSSAPIKGSLPPPTVPRQRIISEPSAPPIPPKPVR